jgi:hypothetical protein
MSESGMGFRDLHGQHSFTTDDCLVAVSKWVDEYEGPGFNEEALMWSRVTKVCEEAGEAMSALLGMTGRNPRKGLYATADDLIKELLDTAMAALGAVEHVTGNQGQARQLLDLHIVRIAERAGVI